MYSVGFNRYGSTPPVVKNLILINVVLLIATWALNARFSYDLTEKLGLFYIGSPNFRPYQLITHMFMHGGLTHIFFNMFALWMFGKILENVWGSKRFFFYYMVTGLGAAALHLFVMYLQISHVETAIQAFANTPSPELFASIVKKHFDFALPASAGLIDQWSVDPSNSTYAAQAMHALREYYTYLINIPTVGASGAVYGVLLAFGMLFPNTELMLLFPPIPIKAKWIVIAYGSIELYLGITQPGSNVAHFAHLGGMLFGFILIKYWNTKRTDFY